MKTFKEKSFKIISLISLFTWSNQAFGMLRRLAPRIVPAATTSILLTQQRTLCDNQANDPMWIKANHQVDMFLRKHDMKVEPKELEQISLAIDNLFDQQLGPAISIPQSYDSHQITLVNQAKAMIHPLLKKHNLQDKVHARFINIPDITPARAGGMSLCLNTSFLPLDPALQATIIEHELGHLICKDAEHLVKHEPMLDTNPSLRREYQLLFEQRADTHSALQSQKNARELLMINEKIGGGYSKALKKFEIDKCMNDTTLDNATKAKRLQRLVKKPTYLEELLAYMAKKEALKQALPPVIQL